MTARSYPAYQAMNLRLDRLVAEQHQADIDEHSEATA